MTKNNTSSTSSEWTGLMPVDDTALAVTDTGGHGIPVVYLNGQFATQGYWRRVIAELVSEGVEAIAICLLHAYVNPEHERRLAALVREIAPQMAVACAS